VKLRRSVLSRYIDTPAEPRALRDLFDDLGLEVKRLDVLPDRDLALTLELLANRGDHHCYAGIARELLGRTGAPVALPPLRELQVGDSPVPVLIETPACLRYTATLLTRDEPGLGRLADVSLAPIVAAEQASISAPVDATNLANLEFGQPTHAFDADTIRGAIRVRDSRPGERAWPLFAPAPVEVPTGTLVIADDEKILGIAGVIGCEESKTTESTRRILLESATFDPIRVRKAARGLGLSTDASARFERGADPTLPLVGAGRVAHLLEREAGWRVQGPTGVHGDWRDPMRLIPLSVPAAAAFLEYPLQADEIASRLGRWGFRVSGTWPDWQGEDPWRTPPELDDLPRERLRSYVLVLVPPHRLWDVEDASDLLEELARSIGYSVTPERLPAVNLGAAPTPAEERKARVTEHLIGHGFYEVLLDGFHGRDLHDKLGLPADHPLSSHVQTLNALDRGYSLLKNSPLPQALDGLAATLNLKRDRVKVFEWTRTFHPDKTAGNGVCRERPVLWALATGPDRAPSWADKGRAADAWYLKGVLEELAVDQRLDLALGPLDPSVPVSALLHPGRAAVVTLDGRAIGALGEVHPAIVAAFKIKRARPVYLELDAAPLLHAATAATAWAHPTTLQPIERSLAFGLPLGVHAGEIVAALRAAGPAWLDRADITDLFAYDDGGAPMRAVTFALTFSAEAAPRSAEAVNGACDALISAVLDRFGGRGVRLRA
jgi:phenylalanyl-tRNA synthetase beta chain